jgi:hypothetical protein
MQNVGDPLNAGNSTGSLVIGREKVWQAHTYRRMEQQAEGVQVNCTKVCSIQKKVQKAPKVVLVTQE